jgi:hypothetical protein
MHAPRQKNVPGFAGHEGHGVHGSKGVTSKSAGLAIYTRGQVDGEHRKVLFPDAADDALRLIGQIAAQTGTEEGVDHEIALCRIIPLDWENRNRAGGLSASGISLQGGNLRQAEKGDRAAGSGKGGGCDISIASIVARTAEDNEA